LGDSLTEGWDPALWGSGAWAAVAVDRSERPLRVRNPPPGRRASGPAAFQGYQIRAGNGPR
jgi:hypothetical protein